MYSRRARREEASAFPLSPVDSEVYSTQDYGVLTYSDIKLNYRMNNLSESEVSVDDNDELTDSESGTLANKFGLIEIVLFRITLLSACQSSLLTCSWHSSAAMLWPNKLAYWSCMRSI